MFRRILKRVLGPTLSNARFLFAAPLAYAPGHFYSPICSPAELKRRYRDPAVNAAPAGVAGVDLGLEAQISLWESWRDILPAARQIDTADKSRRFVQPSDAYGVGDAIVYGCMLRHLKPQRLIEIGSGWSSALALDVFDSFSSAWPKVTFIDPYPALLRSLLKPSDLGAVEIIESGVQDIAPAYFDTLQRNDILFIDSTHIVKTGSDVVFELFDILPTLKPGVVVHFHDMFYPFEYPRRWAVELNYSWNELYVLRAFLTGNRDWDVLFFNDYFAKLERARVQRDAPEMLRNPGGGLWLQRR